MTTDENKKTRRYRTTNWREYNAALKARGSLLVWLDRDMKWQAEPTGKRGRSPTFTDAAIQFCLTVKALFGLPLRQTSGMVESVLKLAGLAWPVPEFSTLSRRQEGLQVEIGYRASAALQLLVDRTGVKMLGEGEWKCRQHGADYRRQRLKMLPGQLLKHGKRRDRHRLAAAPAPGVRRLQRP